MSNNVGENKVHTSEVFKNWFEVFALLLAALWALYTFYFDKVLTPANEPPYLNVSAELTIEGEKDSFYVVKTVGRIKNTGKIRTFIHAASFQVLAYRIDPDNCSDSVFVYELKRNVSHSEVFPRYYVDSLSVMNAGKFVGDGWRMDPGEEFIRSFLTLIPRKSFDAASCEIDIYASRRPETKLQIDWQVNDTGIIRLRPYKMPEHEALSNIKHPEIIRQLGLGVCYHKAEIFLPGSATNKRLSTSKL